MEEQNVDYLEQAETEAGKHQRLVWDGDVQLHSRF